jgi:hypothetical protein
MHGKSTLVQTSNRKNPRSTYVGRIRKPRMGRFLTAIRDDLTLTYPTCRGDTFAANRSALTARTTREGRASSGCQ